jgi:hypothetical protein
MWRQFFGLVFASNLVQETALPTQILHGFPHSLQTNYRMVPLLGHYLFLPVPLQFAIHPASVDSVAKFSDSTFDWMTLNDELETVCKGAVVIEPNNCMGRLKKPAQSLRTSNVSSDIRNGLLPVREVYVSCSVTATSVVDPHGPNADLLCLVQRMDSCRHPANRLANQVDIVTIVVFRCSEFYWLKLQTN